MNKVLAWGIAAIVFVVGCASTRGISVEGGYEPGVPLLDQAAGVWPQDMSAGICEWGTARGERMDDAVRARAEHGALLRILSRLRATSAELGEGTFLNCLEQYGALAAVRDSLDAVGVVYRGVYLSDSLIARITDCTDQ